MFSEVGSTSQGSFIFFKLGLGHVWTMNLVGPGDKTASQAYFRLHTYNISVAKNNYCNLDCIVVMLLHLVLIYIFKRQLDLFPLNPNHP